MQDLFSIKGKTALVTGGSRGIGEMIAAGFLANGARVYISSRKKDVCDATAKRLMEKFGGECISLPADLSNIDGIDAAVKAFGEKEDKLDILVTMPGSPGARPLMNSRRLVGTRSWTPTSKASFSLPRNSCLILKKMPLQTTVPG